MKTTIMLIIISVSFTLMFLARFSAMRTTIAMAVIVILMIISIYLATVHQIDQNSCVRDPAACRKVACCAENKKNGEIMEEQHWLWYSEKQKQVISERTSLDNVAQLDNGDCAIYTEMVPVGRGPVGKWDDYVFVGKGAWMCRR